jgi:type I restriction enzyme M protein
LQANAKQPGIGKLVDDAMDAIERENPSLKGVLPKQYARPALDKQRLGELIDLVGTIGLGDKESHTKTALVIEMMRKQPGRTSPEYCSGRALITH